MSDQNVQYSGTTFLLVTIQVVGALTMIGAILIAFNGRGPFVVPFAISGFIGGLTMTAMAAVGRVVVESAAAFQNNLPNQSANQLHQLKAAEATLAALKERT